jgi:hypothetical protein
VRIKRNVGHHGTEYSLDLTFIHHVQQMYTQYTNNYESAVVMLEQSAHDKDILYQFIQRCYGGRSDVHTFDSYLIMPIQR